MTTNPMNVPIEDCQVFYKTSAATYETEVECMEKAKNKAYEMTSGFDTLNIPYQSMEFGCTIEDIQL